MVGFILLSIIPSAVFTRIEDWEFSDSFYFTIVTLLTIGFGDFTPTAGKCSVVYLYQCFQEPKRVRQLQGASDFSQTNATDDDTTVFEAVSSFLVDYGLYRVDKVFYPTKNRQYLSCPIFFQN